MSSYQNQFIEIIHYIERNLDAELDIEKLCQLACLSKYHFHRQCSAFFGMSVMSLVKLLRLKRAAYQLAYRNNDKVLDIALNNGYDSHEAFSRAFKKIFKQSPSNFRQSPDWNPWQSHYEPIIELRTKIMSDHTDFHVDIVNFPETKVAVLEHRAAPNLLGNSIRQFIEWRRANKLPPSKSRTFNLIYDDPAITAEEEYRFDLCCSINQPVDETNNIKNKRIPSEDNVQLSPTYWQ